MTLVLVLAAIGVAGLLMLVGYAIWLAHKTSDLFAELKVLGQRGSQFARVAGQIRMPDRSADVAAVDGQVAPVERPARAGDRPAAQPDDAAVGHDAATDELRTDTTVGDTRSDAGTRDDVASNHA